MAPVFMNEFQSRKDYYLEYLKDIVGTDIDGKSDDTLLSEIHEYRRDMFSKLTDAVYKEKGYDINGIPTEEKLKSMGMDLPDFLEIVTEARKRFE